MMASLHEDSQRLLNQVHCADAGALIAAMPDDSVDLVVTSPPYWVAVTYETGIGAARPQWPSYQAYLDDLFRVWRECARVLRPNGKLAINTPILPIPKGIIDQHTRHLKNISNDVERMILERTALQRFSLFVWQKQTSKMMFGSYPYPGNIFENNTIEFINVFVKPGKPPRYPADVKQANAISRGVWLDLTQQVWFMYPEDVRRAKNHPAPFPEKLPARLMRLYTYAAFKDFPGEIVLDPYAGTGTTCAVAKSMGRRFIGIDVVPEYVELARRRVLNARPFQPLLLVGRPRYPTKDELTGPVKREAGTAGGSAGPKHKRRTFGRGLPKKNDKQLTLV